MSKCFIFVKLDGSDQLVCAFKCLWRPHNGGTVPYLYEVNSSQIRRFSWKYSELLNEMES